MAREANRRERTPFRAAKWVLAGAILAMFAFRSADAQEITDPRVIAVGQINESPTFLVRVEVDHHDRVYRGGEMIKVLVHSEREGYLYLFYCDADGQVACLFPNRVQRDNFVPANKMIMVPDPAAGFCLRVAPPFGSEVLKAVVTTEPLKSLELEALIKSDATLLKAEKLKRVIVEVTGSDPTADWSSADTPGLDGQERPTAGQWAEHYVHITTLGADQSVAARPSLESLPRLADVISRTERAPHEATPSPPASPWNAGRPKRVGVFIGVSNYQDPEIRPLKAAHRDAQALAETLRHYGPLDDAMVLVNEKATLHNIQRVLREGLPAATSPGDLVILYWSGHGGRTSNLDGTEPDGYDEYLVPYDGRLEPADALRQTMLLDKTFGRWVQLLDGRQLVVIIDACHSGGQTQDAVKSLTGGDPDVPFRKFFFATMWKRTKDIGQRETAVLASSRATQVSFERRGGELSVMTHFLIEKLTNSAGPVTLLDAVEYVKDQVPAFVEKDFPGTSQTPVFVDQTTPPVYLRSR